MNYRHAFHAGNFADVVKHAVFCRVLTHLADKPAPFRVIDTHAGAGVYDLAGAEAERTLEWREGIGRLASAALDPETAALFAPYLQAVAARNPSAGLKVYPGSPALALSLMRPQDRLVASELEPRAAAALAHGLRGDARAKALALDGWTALNAGIPPRERRGVVLVDPPFEQPGEFVRLAQALEAAHRKWATGIYLLWYPIKDGAEAASFGRRIGRLRIAKTLRLELMLPTSAGTGLRGTGMIAVNPPWRLEDELKRMLPALGRLLERDAASTVRLDWLTGEAGS